MADRLPHLDHILSPDRVAKLDRRERRARTCNGCGTVYDDAKYARQCNVWHNRTPEA